LTSVLDFRAPRAYARAMVRLLRLVVFVVLLSVVISIAVAETGPFEKGAVFLLGAGSVWLASRLRGTAMRPA
jgi:hypothetical protein